MKPSASILLVLTPLLLLFPPFLLPLLLSPVLTSSFALRTAFAVLFPNCHPKLCLVHTASHLGCFKPLLHLSPLHFATYLTFPFPLAWYSLTGNPLLLYQFQNHPLLLILLLTMGLPLSFVSSANFLKSIFTLSSLIFVSRELISPFQFGFLPQRSTASALLFSTHSILSLLESHEHRKVI